MNVIKLSLQVNQKKLCRLKNSVREHLTKEFSKNTKNTDHNSYYETVKEVWRNIEYKNVKALYSEKDIIALGNINKIRYFIFNEENIGVIDNNQIHIDVLMICNNNIDLSINYIIKDIKRKVKKIKISAIKEENVYLYRFNKGEKDILLEEENSVITANFADLTKWNIGEKIQVTLMFIISVISLAYAFNNSSNENMSNLLIGIGGSALLSAISVIIIKIFENIMQEERIEIKDLNNFINNELSNLYTNQTEMDGLKNPISQDKKNDSLFNPVKNN